MNQENRQKVLDYLNSDNVESIEPLIFNGYISPKDEFDPNKYTIDNMINRVIILSREFTSVNSTTNEFETPSLRRRSSLDIWRHIKYYYPTIEIFDVMSALYKLYNTQSLKGAFCTDVNRRVFHNDRFDWYNYMTPNEMVNYCGRTKDEYGLVWKDWENI